MNAVSPCTGPVVVRRLDQHSGLIPRVQLVVKNCCGSAHSAVVRRAVSLHPDLHAARAP